MLETEGGFCETCGAVMSNTPAGKKTPLFEHHVALGGRMVTFAGWELPIWYSSIIGEHTAVRNAAGLFDVSHMGEIFVEGPEAEQAIDHLTCNDVKVIGDGKAQYSALTTPSGGVVDDIIVYRYSKSRYLICVNAANADRDFAWMQEHNRFKATFANRSAEFGQIALQGPRALDIIARLDGGGDAPAIPYFFFRDLTMCGVPVIVARTGYTGEDGFEIFVPWGETPRVWEALMQAGHDFELVPAGLGARDSLRLEACLPLHGHELGEEFSAFESGLGWIVKLDKGEFIGREALAAQKRAGAPRALCGFFVEDAGIARHGDKVFDDTGREVGVVTSGTKTPTVDRALGLALVAREASAVDTPLSVEVRGRRLRCRVVKRPFYKRA